MESNQPPNLEREKSGKNSNNSKFKTTIQKTTNMAQNQPHELADKQVVRNEAKIVNAKTKQSTHHKRWRKIPRGNKPPSRRSRTKERRKTWRKKKPPRIG